MNPQDKRWTPQEVLETFGEDIAESSTDAIEHRAKLLDNEVRIYRNEKMRLQNEEVTMKERIKENKEKIKMNKQLPYLVSNVVEVCLLLCYMRDRASSVLNEMSCISINTTVFFCYKNQLSIDT